MEMIAYVLELRTGPKQASTIRVERHTRRAATGLWNRLRRRRWITDVKVEGIFMANVRRFELSHNLNRASTLSLQVEGRDPLANFERRWPAPKMEEIH